MVTTLIKIKSIDLNTFDITTDEDIENRLEQVNKQFLRACCDKLKLDFRQRNIEFYPFRKKPGESLKFNSLFICTISALDLAIPGELTTPTFELNAIAKYLQKDIQHHRKFKLSIDDRTLYFQPTIYPNFDNIVVWQYLNQE